jgi:O-acetyl-ADP-ribose deacetylase (regulator of RNase III)
MDAGSGMVYSSQTIDGLATAYGGAEYKMNLAALRERVGELKAGCAEVCLTGGSLKKHFGEAIQCAVPFSDDPDPTTLLQTAWLNALRASTHSTVYAPVMGAGCRGFDVAVACEVACRSIREYASSVDRDRDTHVALVVSDVAIGETLVASLEAL